MAESIATDAISATPVANSDRAEEPAPAELRAVEEEVDQLLDAVREPLIQLLLTLRCSTTTPMATPEAQEAGELGGASRRSRRVGVGHRGQARRLASAEFRGAHSRLAPSQSPLLPQRTLRLRRSPTHRRSSSTSRLPGPTTRQSAGRLPRRIGSAHWAEPVPVRRQT